MKKYLLKQLILVIIFVLSVNFTGAQSIAVPIQKHQVEKNSSNSNTNLQDLDLKPDDKEIEYVFHFSMSKSDYKKLSKKKNIEKNYITDCSVRLNNDSLSVKEIELRGKSSMTYQRKSFSVKLNDKIYLNKNGATYKFKKFNLISLSMDQNYYRNKVAFDLMNYLGIFNLFYAYSEVIVNGESQGIYLMLQKPKNYAFKHENADFILRRDFQHEVKKTYYKGDDTTRKAECEKVFLSIYDEILKKKGQALYEELSKVLDIEQYFTWMAFNYLIENGDYTDEVFFYNIAEHDSIKFGIIPWDYEDILYDYPREGYLLRYINFGDRLAFSSEDDLDFELITDNYTYIKYLEILAGVVQEISIPVLKDIFEKTFQEIYPFYCKEEIIKKSKFDKYGKTDLNILKADMQSNYDRLVKRRKEVVLELESLVKSNNNNSAKVESTN